MSEATTPRIVVGVDGSEASREALRWAVDEAGRRHAEVEAVHVWNYAVALAGAFGGTAPVIDPGDYERSAQATLAEALADVGTAHLDHPLTPVLVCGGAADALLTRAKGADLLVVGSRGRGGFAGLLLGSVSQQVAQHSPCPTVIVREHSEKAEQAE